MERVHYPLKVLHGYEPPIPQLLESLKWIRDQDQAAMSALTGTSTARLSLIPLASLPAQISGRNRVWRRLIIDAIRTDPEWQDGNYQTQPRSMRIALEMAWLMGNNPVQRLKEAPTLAEADAVLERYLADRLPQADANDYLYAFEASHDYDPRPDLEKIKTPLLAINFADDLINPPELRVLETEIKRVKRGKAIIIPLSEAMRGHGTHTLAPIWKKHLARFLKKTERKS